MEISITYNKKELETVLSSIIHKIQDIDSEIETMELQGLGLADHLNWQSSAKHLRLSLEAIKTDLNRFELSKPFNNSHISEHTYTTYLQSLIETHVQESYNREELL